MKKFKIKYFAIFLPAFFIFFFSFFSEANAVMNITYSCTGVPSTVSAFLSWDTVSGATNYNLFKSPTGGYPSGVLVVNSPSTAYTDSGLLDSTFYQYWSSAPPPAIFNNAQLNSATSPNCDATINVVQVGGTGTFNITPQNKTGPSNIVRPASAGTTYTIGSIVPPAGSTVQSVTNTKGGGTAMVMFPGNNESFTITYTVSPPPKPTLSGSAGACGTGTINLSWSSSLGATGYKLYRGGVEIYNGTGLSFADTGRTAGVTYQYTVRAYNNGGDSQPDPTPPTPPLSIVAPSAGPCTPPPIPSLTATPGSCGTGQIALSFSSAGATSYQVYRGATLIYNSSGTSFTDSGLTAGASYSYTAYASNTFGQSLVSSPPDVATAPAVCPPSPPTGLTASTGSCGTGAITVSWNPVAGATNYDLRDGATTIYTGSGTSYSHTGLTAGSSHSYSVRVTTGAGTSVYSGVVGGTAPSACATAPTTPTGLTASAGSCGTGSISVSWNSSSGATGYTLRDGATTIYTGSGTSYSHTGLTAGSSHSYTVLASNGAGSSAYSSAVNGTAPSACVGPTADIQGRRNGTPTYSQGPVTIPSGSLVDISWSSTGATRCVATGGWWVGTYGASGSLTGLGPVSSNASYGISCDTGVSTPAGTDSVNFVIGSVPTTPTGLSGTPGACGTGTINLSWNSVSGATSYELYRGGVQIYSGATNSYSNTGLTAGTSYSYTVRATNGMGSSAQSAAVNVTAPSACATAPTTPTGLSASAGSCGTGTINVSWNTSVGATGYTLRDGATTIYTGSGNSYSHTGLATGSSHSYTVLASNGAGSSVYSSAVNGTAPSACAGNHGAPTNLAAVAGGCGTGQITLNWDTMPKFKLTDVVQPTLTINVRATPSTSGALLGSQTTAAQGSIIGGPTWVTDRWWWQIDYLSGADGWSSGGLNQEYFNRVAGNATYSVLRSTTNGGPYSSIASGVDIMTSAYTSTGNTAGTPYYFVVRTTDSAGSSANSNQGTATGPSSCSNASPTANAGADRAITLPTSSVSSVVGTASDSDGSVASTAWAFVSGPGPTPTISAPSSLTTNLSNMTTAGTYVFRLTVTDNLGATGSDTMQVVVSPSVPTAPTTPTGLTASAGSCGTGSISVSWNSSSGATGYTLRDGATTIYTGSGTSYSHTGLTAGSSHSYTVLASNGAGSSAYSSAVNGTAPSACPTAPTTPTGLSATPGSCGTGAISLSWNSSSGATSYELYRGGVQIYSGATNSYSNTGLTAGTSYSYTVRATNGAGSSAQSAAVNATAPNACAPTATISASPTSVASGGSSTITWSTTNATSCTASASPANSQWTGAKATSGSQSITGITATTNFTLTCTGPGGSANDSASVTVTSTSHTVSLQYSMSPTRSSPQTLNGATIPLNTDVYIFMDVSPTTDVSNVTFTLNGGSANSCYAATSNPFYDPCTRVETGSPYDIAATTGTNAYPFRFLTSGSKTIVSTANYTAGSPDVLTANFTVPAPASATINVVESGASGGSWSITPGAHTGVSNTVTPGGGGTNYTITATPPAGYTVSYSNTDGSGSAMLVSAGQTKQFTLNYTAIPVFDYTLSNNGGVSVTKSGSPVTSNSVTITKTITSGSGTVDISDSGRPSGVSINYVPATRSCSPTCTTQVSFIVDPSASAGTYAITITGTPGNKTTQFNLTITNPPVFSIGACIANPTPAGVGEVVSWSAAVVGGVPPYTYSWTGTDFPTAPAPSTMPYTTAYLTTGSKIAQVTATDAAAQVVQCSSGTVLVNVKPTFEEF